MATAPAPSPPREPERPEQLPLEAMRHRFTVAEFEKAYFAGAFGERKLELLNGEIFEMPPMGDRHYSGLARLAEVFVVALRSRAVVVSQVPLKLGENDSQPEPDFVLVRRDRYEGRVATAADVFFVVEVSDTTLAKDRGVKLAIYARNAVPEVWILNVSQGQLEVYRDPQGDEYRNKQTFDEGQMVAPLEFPDSPLQWW